MGVATCTQTCLYCFGVHARGYRDDGHVAAFFGFTQFACSFDAVHFRHARVHEDEFWPALPGQVDGLDAVFRYGYFVVIDVKHVEDQRKVLLVVFRHENLSVGGIFFRVCRAGIFLDRLSTGDSPKRQGKPKPAAFAGLALDAYSPPWLQLGAPSRELDRELLAWQDESREAIFFGVVIFVTHPKMKEVGFLLHVLGKFRL